MNFELSEEHKMIRDAARDFAQNELLPGVIERDENQAFPHEQIKKMGELILAKLINYNVKILISINPHGDIYLVGFYNNIFP